MTSAADPLIVEINGPLGKKRLVCREFHGDVLVGTHHLIDVEGMALVGVEVRPKRLFLTVLKEEVQRNVSAVVTRSLPGRAKGEPLLEARSGVTLGEEVGLPGPAEAA